MTTLTPHRITFWQHAWANIADRLRLDTSDSRRDVEQWPELLRATPAVLTPPADTVHSEALR